MFGLLRLGRLVGFVSYSVMTGFIIGIAVLTVLSQIPTVTGCGPTGGNKIIQTLDLLANLGRINLLTLALSVLTLILTVVLPRAWLGNPGILVAIAVPSVLVTLFHMSGVQVVQDIGNIPSGIPTPFLPSPSDLTFDVFTGALAVATIILVQGAGVSQSVPNPDGSRRSVSRDVMADDAANIASGVFQGLPVGGSLGASAINVASEVRTRWAAILAGVWVAVILVAVPGLMSYVAMPTLGALLIVASARSNHRTCSRSGMPAGLPGCRAAPHSWQHSCCRSRPRSASGWCSRPCCISTRRRATYQWSSKWSGPMDGSKSARCRSNCDPIP